MFDKCENENIQVMLVPYVEKVLAPNNRKEVELHLRECSSCRNRVNIIRETLRAMGDLVRSGYKPSLASHPLPAKLFSFALEKRSLSSEELAALHKHVAGCPICHAEVQALLKADKEYQSRVITLGTSNLVPALKRSRASSVSVSSESSSEAVPAVASVAMARQTPNWSEYLEQLSHRLNLRRLAIAGGIILVIGYAISFAWCSNDEEKKPSATPSTAITESLPSPSASSISYVLAVDEGQEEALCELLANNKIPFENVDGKIRVPAEYVPKAQQAWIQAVEEAQANRQVQEYEEPLRDSASVPEDATAVSEPAPESVADSSEPAPVNYEEQPAYEAPAYTAEEPASSASDSSSEVSYSTSAPAPVSEPENTWDERPPQTAKPILKPLNQPSAPIRNSTASSSSAASSTAVSSASRPQPKPAIVTPSAPPAVVPVNPVPVEVSSNDGGNVQPHVVRMGAQPAVTTVENEEAQVVRPTPRSVYEESGAEESSGLSSWSNEH